MNEVGIAADAALPEWNVDGSDLEYDSDASLSESEGSEGEVPALSGHLKEDAPPGGVGKGHNKIPGWKSSHMTSADSKESPYARGWKPVIDRRLQAITEATAIKARNAAMLAGSTLTLQKQESSHMPSGTVAGVAKSEIKKDGNESDSDMRRVPDMSSKGIATVPPVERQVHSSGVRPRKRGGGSADKEHKRLKRLLRNRVSAQQARERKKAYLSELEIRSKELTQRNEELEERVSTLQRENYMLRQIVKNTTGKKPGGGAAGMET